MKIFNLGSCNVDYVYTLDHIVCEGETENRSGLEIFPGGKGLNQSIAIARAGAKVYHAGCIGESGEMLFDTLVQSNVDISLIKKVSEKSGHAIIQVSSQGENSIFIYSGANAMITEEYIDYVLEKTSPGDILLLQNEINNIDYIIKVAYKKKLCIILNPSPMNDDIKKVDLNMLKYIILNETEACLLTGSNNAESCLEYFKKQCPKLKVVLTLGSKGCIYMDEENEIYQPAFKVKAVDTTGAGDTFTGYFVAEISRNTAVDYALKIAGCAASISVTKNGATPSIPEKNECLKMLANLKTYDSAIKNDTNKKIVKNYIEKNFRSGNLGELAEILRYSTVYTGNLVKKYTGEPFSRLICKKRCEVAAELLKNTDLPISAIVETIGYENKSFFRYNFKKIYGKNPLEFRNYQKNLTEEE